MILIAIYTATVASVLTTGDLSNRVVGPQDLIGHKVGSNYGSTAADYVTNYGGMQLVLYPTGKDAFFALKQDKVPAIILDYPVLVYYSRLYNEPGLEIVSSILEYDMIGLAMRPNSTMIQTLNGVIVGLTQTGYSSQLSLKWIGEPKRPMTQAYDVFDTVGLWIWMVFWAICGIVAFLLKKYVVKKNYKHVKWYSALGGDEDAVRKEETEDENAHLLPFPPSTGFGSHRNYDQDSSSHYNGDRLEETSTLLGRRSPSNREGAGGVHKRDSTVQALATYSDGEEESDSDTPGTLSSNSPNKAPQTITDDVEDEEGL